VVDPHSSRRAYGLQFPQDRGQKRIESFAQRARRTVLETRFVQSAQFRHVANLLDDRAINRLQFLRGPLHDMAMVQRLVPEVRQVRSELALLSFQVGFLG
jgi:hypothetical protein